MVQSARLHSVGGGSQRPRRRSSTDIPFRRHGRGGWNFDSAGHLGVDVPLLRSHVIPRIFRRREVDARRVVTPQ